MFYLENINFLNMYIRKGEINIFKHGVCKRKNNSLNFFTTRPKPVEHDYVFSMAVSTIGEWLKLVPFLLGGEQLILRGRGAGSFFKINILAVKHLKINILAWVLRKINK